MIREFCIDCDKRISSQSTGRCRGCANELKISHLEGSKSPFWKGIKASYKQIHSYINEKWGKSYKCEVKNCRKTSQTFEWANLSGKYNRDISDWVMSCHSCNQRMDYIRRNGDNCKRGHKYTEKTTAWAKNGTRRCKICTKENSMQWRRTHTNYCKKTRSYS